MAVSYSGKISGHCSFLFENDQPDACIRVRYEDLIADHAARQDLWKFLDLDPGTLPDPVQHLPLASGPLPASQLPPRRLAQVNDLHATLGYPPFSSPAGRGPVQPGRPG
jgi:hypothetical protein